MRHRSTASWRATATMAFLRAAPVARGPTPQQLFHPSRYLERAKVALLPPALYRLQTVIDHQTAPLGFQLLARFDQLLPLPMDCSQLLFFFTGHTHQGQRITIALDKTVQL